MVTVTEVFSNIFFVLPLKIFGPPFYTRLSHFGPTASSCLGSVVWFSFACRTSHPPQHQPHIYTNLRQPLRDGVATIVTNYLPSTKMALALSVKTYLVLGAKLVIRYSFNLVASAVIRYAFRYTINARFDMDWTFP